jgi:hypothetical protein
MKEAIFSGAKEYMLKAYLRMVSFSFGSPEKGILWKMKGNIVSTGTCAG